MDLVSHIVGSLWFSKVRHLLECALDVRLCLCLENTQDHSMLTLPKLLIPIEILETLEKEVCHYDDCT